MKRLDINYTHAVPAAPAPEATREHFSRVCGVDCHPGEPTCNGYCTGKADAPQTYEPPSPITRACQQIEQGATGNGARLSGIECQALRATRAAQSREIETLTGALSGLSHIADRIDDLAQKPTFAAYRVHLDGLVRTIRRAAALAARAATTEGGARSDA